MIGRTLGPAPLSTSNLANFYYKRPPEFLDLAVIPNKGESSGVTDMFTFLVAVFPEPDPNDYQYQISGAPSLSAINNVALHCDVTNSGSWTVDWGDGNPALTAYHSNFSSDTDGFGSSYGITELSASYEGKSDVIVHTPFASGDPNNGGGRVEIQNTSVSLVQGNNYTITFEYFAASDYSGKFWGTEDGFSNRVSISNTPAIATGSWSTATLNVSATRPSSSSIQDLRIRPQDTTDASYGTLSDQVVGDKLAFKNIEVVLDNNGLGYSYLNGAEIYHVYKYDDLPASTEFRGYRQVVLSGFPTDSNNLFGEVKTDIDGPFVPGFTSSHSRNGSNILDMEISSRNATSFDIGGNSRPHKMCERVGLYNTTSNRLTNAQNQMWSGMSNLQEIAFVPYMHVDNTESHSGAFRYCNKLRYLPDEFADHTRYWFWNSESFYICFDACYKLEYLPEGIFTGRGHITELTNVREFRYMFRYCYMIKYIPELPTRTSGSYISVRDVFRDCQHLKRPPKNFRANNVTSSSTDGLRNMFYNCIDFEDFNDWNLLDMDSTAKQKNSIRVGGYMYNCGRDSFYTVPWVGLYLDEISKETDYTTNINGVWRCHRGPQFFAKEYYERGYIDFTRAIDMQDQFSGNYCIKEYPIIQVSPNTLTNNNSIYRTFFANYNLQTLTFSGFAVDETFGNGEYYQAFYQCLQLKSIIGLPWNAANDSGDYSNTFNSVRNIGHFGFPGLSSDQTGFSQSINLSYQPHDLQSIENIFRYLKTGSHTITLNNNNYADAIPATIEAIATDKGWTVTH